MAEVLFEKKGHIAYIKLNRPEVHNAINLEMGERLVDIWKEFRDDDDLWVAIITGAGEKAFSSGADLKSLGDIQKQSSLWELFTQSDRYPDFAGITKNLQVWKPKIAAINGYCFGAGLELALSCEIRIASERATFAFPETGWGMIPGGGGTQRLPRMVSPGLAFEMILTGKRIDTKTAYREGLINLIAEDNEALASEAEKMAENMCDRAPLSLQAATQLIWQGVSMPLDKGLQLETALANLLRSTKDAKEGSRAFAENRSPDFKGE